MGMPSILSSSRGSVRDLNPPTPNPNPTNFRIIVAAECNGLTAALVRYPDATTYEGLKILVLDMPRQEVRAMAALDPHFSENGKVVARFRPDDEGWEDALRYIGSLP